MIRRPASIVRPACVARAACGLAAAALSLSFAGVAAAQLEETWSRLYDGKADGDDEFQMVRADDTGAYVVGDVTEYATFTRDMGLVRFDADGNEMWTIAFDGPTNGNDYGAVLDIHPSGTVYVAGYGYSSGIPNTRMHFMACEPDGSSVYGFTYVYPGSYGNISTDCVVAADGSMYVCGWTTVLGQPTDIAVLKVTAGGSVAWSRKWDGGSYDTPYAIGLDSADNVYVVGRTSVGSGPDDVVVLKYDAAGTLQWDTTWSGPDDLGATLPYLVVQPDDSIVLGGHTAGWDPNDQDLVVTRVTAAGDFDWLWTWAGETGSDDVIQHMIGVDGDLYFAGETDRAATGGDAVVGRVTGDGATGWVDVRTLDDVYPWTDRMDAVAVDADGRAVFLGSGVKALGNGGGDGPPSEYGSWILRYDDEGAFDTELFTARSGSFRSIDIAPDGAIYAAGNSYDGDSDGLLFRTDDGFVDCNGNGVHDPDDIAMGTSPDCNANGIPDECDITSAASLDCDGDGTPDECQIADDPMLDADDTGVLDSCESIGDLDGDGMVGLGDLLALLVAYGECVEGAACPADLDDDGDVDFFDLLGLLANWE